MSEREQLEQSIVALEAQRSILGDAVVDPAIAALREKLAALKAPAAPEQRKQVTILFADVSGFTAMSETMDAEEVRDTMNALWTGLDKAITDHSGLIDKHIGDCVMALFGAPTAHEDDPERAIHAALAMQAELAIFREERQAELAMRIGINTGPVLLGEVGTTAEYTAMGDAVNLASRLEHAAPVGGILVSYNTYRHVRGVFDVQPLEPIQVKGKAEPIRVYVVERAKPPPFRVATRGIEGIETCIIGREVELQRLQDALYTAMDERGVQVVTVVGEAGVGKSRLLYEFNNWIDQLPEAVSLFKGRSSQQTSHLPYALIRDLFARHFGIHDSDSPEVARQKLEQGIVELLDTVGAEKAVLIGHLLGFDFSHSPYLRGIIDDSQQIHDCAFHYIAQYFAAVAPPTAPSPSAEARGEAVILLLEDIHWTDDGSLDLVNYLEQACRHVPLLIVSLARPEFLERRPLWGEGEEYHIRIELRPLSKRDSRHLVDEILQKIQEVPPVLRNLIVERAEGNPFYIEELIKMLIEDGVIVKEPDQWRVEAERLADVRVPPTLVGVLQARLDRLDPVERYTLQRASVVGRVFWNGTVERLGAQAASGTPARQTPDWKDVATLHRMLIQHFSKEELRTLCFDLDVEYDDLPAEGRANKARELISYLDRRDRIPDLVKAGVRLRPDVFEGSNGEPFSDESGTDAALETARDRELIFEREVSTFEGEREYVFKHNVLRDVTYESVLKRMRRIYHALVATWLVERGGERMGEYAGLIGEHYEQAEERAQAAEWYGQAGKRAQETYALETAARYYQKALAMEERWEWHKGQVEVLHILGRRGEEQAGLQALDAISKAPTSTVAYLWGQYYEAIGDFPQAQTALERALAACRDEDDVAGQVRCMAQLGSIARRPGDLEDAKNWYNQALMLFQDQETYSDEESQALAQALNGLGIVHRQQRNFDQAKACYERALVLNRTISDRRGEAEVLNSLGVTARYQRDFAEAMTWCQQSLEIRQAIGDQAGEGVSLMNLAQVTNDIGDYGQTQRYLAAALTIHQATGNRWEQVNAWNSLGILHQELGELCQAESYLQQGLQLAQEIGDEEGQAILLSNLGLVTRDQGNLTTAEQVLTDGLAIVRKSNYQFGISVFLGHLSTVSLQTKSFEKAIEQAQTALKLRQELDLLLYTTDDLATLAAIYLAVGDMTQAVYYAEQALGILEECGGKGPEFPQRDYFICYQVLAEAERTERARDALQSAYDLVINRANRITDSAQRQTFLEQVQINREIVHEYEKVMREA